MHSNYFVCVFPLYFIFTLYSSFLISLSLPFLIYKLSLPVLWFLLRLFFFTLDGSLDS